MKRLLGTLMLAAMAGGCMATNNSPQTTSPATVRASSQYAAPTVPGLVGPWGEPVTAMAPYNPSPFMSARQANYMMSQSVPLNMVNMDQGVVQAGAQMPAMPQGGMVAPPGMPFAPMMPPGGGMMPPPNMPISNGSNSFSMPRLPSGMMISGANGAAPPNSPSGANGLMMPPGSMPFMPGGGPFPGGRPPGAVAAIGALTGNSPYPGAGYNLGRTQVRFVGPSGMKISWLTQGADGKPAYSAPMIETPGRYNFLQASIYRLKLSSIEKRPGLEVYPTLEVVPGNHKTAAFLEHSAVPVQFTDEDWQEVSEGKYLVKVIYLPDAQFQELAAAGTDEISSVRLEPGADPILEAQRRGSILLVIRVGNVDQEAPNTPPLDNRGPQGGTAAMMPPPGATTMPWMMPPGMMPPGLMPPPGMTPPSMAGPLPGPGGPTAGPSIPPYLRSGPALPMPGAPATGPAPGGEAPVPGVPSSMAVPPPPASFSGAAAESSTLPAQMSWPPSTPSTPTGLAGPRGTGWGR